jgi:hypothetical protein
MEQNAAASPQTPPFSLVQWPPMYTAAACHVAARQTPVWDGNIIAERREPARSQATRTSSSQESYRQTTAESFDDARQRGLLPWLSVLVGDGAIRSPKHASHGSARLWQVRRLKTKQSSCQTVAGETHQARLGWNVLGLSLRETESSSSNGHESAGKSCSVIFVTTDSTPYLFLL